MVLSAILFHMQKSPKNRRRAPELLAPAGDRECVVAAIENGADAVYFGLERGFNARARATNHSLGDLPGLMALLHRRGVKGYVTLNTLVFSEELPAIEEAVVELTTAGVDAVLVQDLGLARLIRELSPDLPVHASTQMTLTSAETVRAAERLGVERVVLARELSIDEVRRIREGTSVEIETFVHGALCVAYSGQCLTSESLGGRSANRGQCAQACRLPYELIVDGEDRELGEVKYLLSPQDLAAYDYVNELIDAGVGCLKIEGRLKTPEYVAAVTRHYRQAIDAAMAGAPIRFSQQEVHDLEMTFSRGFSPGWFEGCEHKRLVPGTHSAKRGVRVGEVEAVQGGRVVARLDAELKPGDGVAFEGDRLEGEEQGGRVYAVHEKKDRYELEFGRDALDPALLYPGQAIWKTDDPKLTARVRKTFDGPDPQRRRSIDLQVTAKAGETLTVEAQTDDGVRVHVQSDEPLEAARRHPATEDQLREQLGRLGGSAYELRGLTAELAGEPMTPLSVLGKLRKELIARLDEALEQAPDRRLNRDAMESLRPARVEVVPSEEPTLNVLCRSLNQIGECLERGERRLMADFADIREYKEAARLARDADAELFLATPRIQKPGEIGVFHAMRKAGATGFLVRNLAGIDYCQEHAIRYTADFSLNAANPLTVAHLKELGCERVTASYDLNREQLLNLVAETPPAWLEVVIHQHMPMFHMEHCVFCALISPGTNKTNCGRPCDRHEVQLRDRTGVEHPLTADVGCRNTLFNATPQSAAEAVPALLAAGVRAFRVELLDTTGKPLRKTIRLYRDLLAGRVTPQDVWRDLKASNRVGVTRGTLEERRDPLAIL
ncbi:putative protease YhbU precursor [Planctomycetes bacterium MalM25]|nr:putative protease YhbU precursor [Planctomycetes bacterium MalM25]